MVNSIVHNILIVEAYPADNFSHGDVRRQSVVRQVVERSRAWRPTAANWTGEVGAHGTGKTVGISFGSLTNHTVICFSPDVERCHLRARLATFGLHF